MSDPRQPAINKKLAKRGLPTIGNLWVEKDGFTYSINAPKGGVDKETRDKIRSVVKARL